jgi:glutamine amidotransferase
MAWHGQRVVIDELLFKSQHSLVAQSLHSTMGAEPVNGDGFGVGWYTDHGAGIYRSTQPAWNDSNLRNLAEHIEAKIFLAHVRASSGAPVQQTNCHPFAHENWLMVHNGLINDFGQVKRELITELDDASVAAIQGSADSEVLFHLALANGLRDDPIGALEKAIGAAEHALRGRGVEPEVQASIGVSDGVTLWAVRYASKGPARTLFHSTDVDTLQRMYPGNTRLAELREGDTIVVSEPLLELPGAWTELDEGSAVTVGPDGTIRSRDFAPAA